MGVTDGAEDVVVGGVTDEVSLRGLDGVVPLGLEGPKLLGLEGVCPLGLEDPLLELDGALLLALEELVALKELVAIVGTGDAATVCIRDAADPTFSDKKAGLGVAVGLSPPGGFPHPGQYLIPALTSLLHQIQQIFCVRSTEGEVTGLLVFVSIP